MTRTVLDQGSALRTSCRQGRDRFRPGRVPVSSEEPSRSLRFQPDQQGSPFDCGALSTHGTGPSKVCRGAQEHQGFGGRGNCHHGLRRQRETKVSMMSIEKESHCQRLNWFLDTDSIYIRFSHSRWSIQWIFFSLATFLCSKMFHFLGVEPLLLEFLVSKYFNLPVNA